MINWIIGAIIIAALLAVVLIGIIKAKKNGGVGCGCGCNSCPKSSQCQPTKKKKVNNIHN